MLIYNSQKQTFKLHVNVGDDASFTITCSSWIAVSPMGGTGSKPINVMIPSNSSANSRQGFITVSLDGKDCKGISKTLNILQNGYKETSPIEDIDTDDSTFSVTFQSNNASTINFNGETRNVINGSVTFQNIKSGNYSVSASNNKKQYSIETQGAEVAYDVLEYTPVVNCKEISFITLTKTINVNKNITIPISLVTKETTGKTYTIEANNEYGYSDGNKIRFNEINTTNQTRTIPFTALSVDDTTVTTNSNVTQEASPLKNYLLTVFSESGGTVTVSGNGLTVTRTLLENEDSYYAIFSLPNGNYKINRDKPDDIIGQKYYKGLEVSPKTIEFLNPNETVTISVSGWTKIDDTIKFIAARQKSVTINNSNVTTEINFGKNIIPGSGDKWMLESDIKATFTSSNPNFKIQGSKVTSPSQTDTFQSTTITISALDFNNAEIIATLKPKDLELSEKIILSLEPLNIRKNDLVDSIIPIDTVIFENVGGSESLYGYYIIYDPNTNKVLSSTNLFFEND